MDVGKKCLIMAGVGTLLAIFSAPFVIYMIFTGRLITTFVETDVLEPFPPNIYGPASRIINRNATFPYSVMEFNLNPGGEKQQYKVTLNVQTNDTTHISISRRNSAYAIADTFNAGNHTREIQITSIGLYVLNVTSTDNRTISASFKVTESWYYNKKELVGQLDLLKTAGSTIGFVAGLVILVGALVKLRRAAREARPATTRRTGGKQPSYMEVEEEEE
ncbi:MAG: hypothetical protein QXF52_02330 [Thermoproteota archaeon]